MWKERIFEFLAGLNMEFDQVRVQILGKDTMPSLNEVFSLIRAEEGRRTVMLEMPNHHSEGCAMMITERKTPSEALNVAETKKNGQKSIYKDNLWCRYCRKRGHTKDNCWKLHGKPLSMSQGGGHRGNQEKSQAHHTNMERLRNFLNTLEKPSGSCSLAQNGNILNSYVFSASNKCNSTTWVIDSGATDHMAHSTSCFTTYQPCSSNRKIKVADGSLINVVGQGTVVFSSMLILKDVLHVPKLSVNLLSISKITQDLNCHETFFNDRCIFQDQTMGRMIGQARAMEGLYLLKDKDSYSEPLHLSLISVNSNKDEIWNHHRRLGHPLLKTQQRMFPSLFRNSNVETFHCEV